MTDKKKLRIAVIGAGASGLMALIKLREAGIHDVTVYEKARELGGTWRDNRYPGVTCDVPSHGYRYSFEPNAEWSHVCAPGPEILDYLKAVARKHGADAFIKYGQEVVRADYGDGQWTLETTDGPQGAFDAVITATGVLHHPVYPDIPGLEDFEGAAFHTARWDDTLSLKGKRIGVIGTGSTATQVVGAVVDEAATLTLFQRTAQWILPLPQAPIPEEQKALYRADPALLEQEYQRISFENNTKFAAAIVGANPHAYRAMVKACEENLARVQDPVLRKKLTPDYAVGCKRMILSDRFYEAMQQPNAELVTERIERFERNGIRTVDGRLHELDVIVLATGFNTHQLFRPMQVTGRGGKTMDEAWAKGNEGYKAVTVPDFPNWFMIGGPNSPIGNFSWLLTAENQFNFALKLILKLSDGNVSEIAPKREAARAFNEAVRAKLPDTVWATGCKSWYIDSHGNIASWPWTYEKFEADMREPVWDDFEVA
ncbi:MAG: NAD(P)/FAD-dependent oxidoreductase [Parvibaculum sp.]